MKLISKPPISHNGSSGKIHNLYQELYLIKEHSHYRNLVWYIYSETAILTNSPVILPTIFERIRSLLQLLVRNLFLGRVYLSKYVKSMDFHVKIICLAQKSWEVTVSCPPLHNIWHCTSLMQSDKRGTLPPELPHDQLLSQRLWCDSNWPRRTFTSSPKVLISACN